VLGGDIAGRAGAVLDHHGLAEPRCDALGQHARGGVGAAARREADHEAHRALGAPGGAGRRGLRAGHSRENDGRHRCEQRKEIATLHEMLPPCGVSAALRIVRGATTVAHG
jgi:hypothetical protein